MESRELRHDSFRFWLRPTELADADAIHDAAVKSRERVGLWMDWLTPSYSLRDARKWTSIAKAHWEEGSAYEFVIIDSSDGAVSGCCGLNRINRKDLVCNLGYWVRESKIRQAAAFQAARLLQEFGLGQLVSAAK